MSFPVKKFKESYKADEDLKVIKDNQSPKQYCEFWARWGFELGREYGLLEGANQVTKELSTAVEKRDAKIKEILLSDWATICKKQPETAEKWARQYFQDADDLIAGETVIACVLKGTITRFTGDYHEPTIAEVWEKSKISVALVLLGEL